MSPELYFHTLRHLRLAQLVGRVRFALARPRPNVSAAPPRTQAAQPFPLPPLHRQSLTAQEVFEFLNVTRSVPAPGDWNDPRAARLWLYNLHYFDDLNAVGREARSEQHQRLVDRWIAENAPGAGVGWEPYPLSLRIVNWIKWSCSGHALSDAAVHSLAVQARYLLRRLEYHLLGNHLLANAKALVFAGAFFDGDEALDWRSTGLGILGRELPEQILADGGHFERSPMYHAIVLEDVLDLLALTRVFPAVASPEVVEGWEAIAGDMSRWLGAMCHPDGDISFFNDAAFGIALSPGNLRACSDTLGLAALPPVSDGVVRLDGSGYLRMQQGPLTVIFDAAPVGPDYIPGHAHADTLSFELSWNAQRVLTNSGTSTYAAGPERGRERSTAAHNTVEIDGQDSSEVWSAFRVARRARPLGLKVECTGDRIVAKCTHDGYARLVGAPLHQRTIEASRSGVRVRDRVSGRGLHRVSGRYHLHPDTRLGEESNGAWIIRLPQGETLSIRGLDGLRLDRETGSYAPEFGKSVPRPVLAWSVEQRLPLTAGVEIAEAR